MKLDGNRIVEESLEWDGTPESYFAARNAKTPARVVAHGTSPGVAQVPPKVGELVPEIWQSLCESDDVITR